MPTHDYVCENTDCQMEFEKLVPPGSDASPECPVCGSTSDRKLSAPNFRFEDGPDLGNTGVDSLDSNPDIAIGRASDRRWETVKDREREKRDVRRGVGDPEAPLKTTEEGYEPVSEEEREEFEKMHAINDAAEKKGKSNVDFPDED